MHKVGDNKNIIIIVLIAIFGLAVFTNDLTRQLVLKIFFGEAFRTPDFFIQSF